MPSPRRSPPHHGADDRYDDITISLHWLAAGLIVILFVMAEIWGFLPRGGGWQAMLKSLHVSLGVLLILAVLARLVWRSLFGRHLRNEGVAGMAAKAVHVLLYLIMLAMILSGPVKSWTHGHGLSVFWLFSIPTPFAMPPAWHGPASFVHHWAAWAIIVIAGFHASAALFHHYGLRDGVLHRMLPGARGGAGRPVRAAPGR